MQKVNCPVNECPKSGDVYFCEVCGMTAMVVRDCKCSEAACVSFACCGMAMDLVNATGTA